MSQSVGNIIAEQIGTRAFAMMGARDLLASDDALQFKVGKNAKRIASIRVVLAADDTYSVEFWRGRGLDWSIVDSVSFVYADQLRTTIEHHTGLYLSL